MKFPIKDKLKKKVRAAGRYLKGLKDLFSGEYA